MADVPAKLNYNESIRRIPEKVNEILDYLKRTRIQVDPRTMRKNETPAGITLSAQRQTVATPTQQLPEDGYIGYFKVIDASEGDAFKVKVIDGKDPDGEYCGYTDIVGKVPVAILDNPADKLIILSAEYDTEDQNYKLEIVAKTEAEVKGLCYFLLAEVKSDRSILQRWEAGTINFGERYVI